MKSEFDRDLASYVISTKVRASKPENAGQGWLRYTAAAGSALAMASAADATVIYSGLQNIGFTNAGQTGIDLDFDGVDEFNMQLTGLYGWTLDPQWWGVDGSATVSGADNPANFLTNGFGSVRNLSSGATISAGSLTWWSSFGTVGTNGLLARGSSAGSPSTWSSWLTSGGGGQGEFADSVNGLAGFSFDIDGNSHYGWIRFHVDVNALDQTLSMTAIDWAYEDVAGVAILAGDKGPTAIPEPATLGLFLLGGGAMGLATWRRRRQSVDSAQHQA